MSSGGGARCRPSSSRVPRARPAASYLTALIPRRDGPCPRHGCEPGVGRVMRRTRGARAPPAGPTGRRAPTRPRQLHAGSVEEEGDVEQREAQLPVLREDCEKMRSGCTTNACSYYPFGSLPVPAGAGRRRGEGRSTTPWLQRGAAPAEQSAAAPSGRATCRRSPPGCASGGRVTV